MKLKVCGMKYEGNIGDVAKLQPDYLGFIFWKNSKRFFEGPMPQLPEHIKKVGVFVDATIEEVYVHVKKYNLQAVQLHGKESPAYCKALQELATSSKTIDDDLKTPAFEIIKVFSIKDDFDFCQLEAFEEVCDYFLFDTKGKLPGGNGYTFNWAVLENYPSTKPYFLSGGIGLQELDNIKAFLQTPASKYCHVIDVNSQFEVEPGLKNIMALEEFRKTVH
ncbi:phosphoribosylanthranilate isomerase [Spongiimicrobium salis]|uniref:phosphoribosylanthranilate isomerase n=1 Tax=Spongiimicrobium salis TaxID=1667022 RepID=UPI00374C9C46